MKFRDEIANLFKSYFDDSMTLSQWIRKMERSGRLDGKIQLDILLLMLNRIEELEDEVSIVKNIQDDDQQPVEKPVDYSQKIKELKNSIQGLKMQVGKLNKKIAVK